MKFKDLKIGSGFVVENENTVYMKVVSTEYGNSIIVISYSSDLKYTAGKFAEFDEDIDVIKSSLG